MSTDREDAATSLAAIEDAERRTGRAIFYGVASSFLFMWGGITTFGYVYTAVKPSSAGLMWTMLISGGFIATALMVARSRQRMLVQHDDLGWRLVYAQVALIGFGLTVVTVLGPFTGRQLNAFWPLVFMLGYVLAGIWIGRFFIVCGAAIAVLTVAGFWWAGPWFPLWMAAVNGGALMLGGLWLRKQGASL